MGIEWLFWRGVTGGGLLIHFGGRGGQEPPIASGSAGVQRVRKSVERQRTADRRTSATTCVAHVGDPVLLLAL